MTDRPLLYSGPMVRAVQAGIKKQTRRVAKLTEAGHVKEPGGYRRWHPADPEARLACPYGQPGDRLWVRENGWERPERTARMMREGADTWAPYYYDADGISDTEAAEFKAWGFKRRPSIHMPRWASRITLEITAVRLERLQDISDADAIAEGIERSQEYPTLWKRGLLHGDQNKVKITGFPFLAYRSIWEEINGHESWSENPLVWVVEFKVVKP